MSWKRCCVACAVALVTAACGEAALGPPLPPPHGADVVVVVEDGRDPGALAPLRVPGKITVFDFYADWCPPCRKVDEHLYPIVAKRADVAVRKINIVSWETPVATRALAGVPQLPYLVVYGRNGELVDEISGADFERLDRALGGGAP